MHEQGAAASKNYLEKNSIRGSGSLEYKNLTVLRNMQLTGLNKAIYYAKKELSAISPATLLIQG